MSRQVDKNPGGARVFTLLYYHKTTKKTRLVMKWDKAYKNKGW